MPKAVILSAARTAIGTLAGGLSQVPATTLGAIAVREAVSRAKLNPEQVNEVILGHVLPAGLGLNPARVAALESGVPKEVPSFGVNKACGSGLKAVALAAQSILLGDAVITSSLLNRVTPSSRAYFDVLNVAPSGRAETVKQVKRVARASGVSGVYAPAELVARRGDVISGLPKEAEDAMVFHAGTRAEGGNTVTAGGRVLCVTALADTVKQAQQRAYEVLQGIRFDGAQWRRDIGHRAVKG